MGRVKSHFWDEINRVRCAECDGNGGTLSGSWGGEVEVADCEHCHGEGECACPDCINAADDRQFFAAIERCRASELRTLAWIGEHDER